MAGVREQFRSVREDIAKWLGDVGISRLSIGAAADIGRGLATQFRDILGRYDSALAFQADWKWARMILPLQVRLIVEQVLWDKGGHWRKMVTGFRPIATKHQLEEKY